MTPHPDLEAIRARHESDEKQGYYFGAEAHADRAALLAEVERLRAVVDAATFARDVLVRRVEGRSRPNEASDAIGVLTARLMDIQPAASLQEESSNA